MISETAVFDAGPVIAFHQIDRLDLLHQLFTRSMAPPEVVREVSPSVGVLPQWIESWPIDAVPIIGEGLGAGERAAIALALRVAAEFVVLDDRRARKLATELGLTTIGSLGLLVRAKRRGLIEEVEPLMIEMIGHGLFVHGTIRTKILALAGESPT